MPKTASSFTLAVLANSGGLRPADVEGIFGTMSLLQQLQQTCEANAILVLGPGEERVVDPLGNCSGETVILRPTTTDELSQMLALCHEFRQPLIPIGGGIGLSGGTKRLLSSKSQGEWYLSSERMTSISDFDPINQTVTVQPGVVLSALQGFVQEQGLDFPVDLGARDSATLGGMVSTNAGGEMAFRFGMTREQVLGMEVVLADGRVLDLMSNVRKDNSGLDLKQLFIGAEGTLGVISKISLKLTERGQHGRTALIGLEQFEQVLALKSRMSRVMGRNLIAFEYMEDSFFEAVLHGNKHQRPFEAAYPRYALVELESGNDADIRTFEALLGQAWEEGQILDVVISQNDTQSGKLWAIRNDIASMHEYLISMIPFDVSVSLSQIETLIEDIKDAMQAYDPSLKLLVWAHLGDNNLHLSVGGEADVGRRKHEICTLIYERVAAAGGSISAEHGIGYDKKPWLPLTRNELALSLM